EILEVNRVARYQRIGGRGTEDRLARERHAPGDAQLIDILAGDRAVEGGAGVGIVLIHLGPLRRVGTDFRWDGWCARLCHCPRTAARAGAAGGDADDHQDRESGTYDACGSDHAPSPAPRGSSPKASKASTEAASAGHCTTLRKLWSALRGFG